MSNRTVWLLYKGLVVSALVREPIETKHSYVNVTLVRRGCLSFSLSVRHESLHTTKRGALLAVYSDAKGRRREAEKDQRRSTVRHKKEVATALKTERLALQAVRRG